MQQTGIKAIETRYNGYRFRSRLEARWAVFFDALGIKYQYELEGFEIDGHGYLPDFYLPLFDCWVEVKPKPLTFPEFAKCFAVNKRFLFLDGQPELRGFYLLDRSTFPPDTWCLELYHDYFDNLMQDGRIGSMIHLGPSANKGRLWFLYGESVSDYDNQQMEGAIKMARQARFEHE